MKNTIFLLALLCIVISAKAQHDMHAMADTAKKPIKDSVQMDMKDMRHAIHGMGMQIPMSSAYSLNLPITRIF